MFGDGTVVRQQSHYRGGRKLLPSWFNKHKLMYYLCSFCCVFESSLALGKSPSDIMFTRERQLTCSLVVFIYSMSWSFFKKGKEF